MPLSLSARMSIISFLRPGPDVRTQPRDAFLGNHGIDADLQNRRLSRTPLTVRASVVSAERLEPRAVGHIGVLGVEPPLQKISPQRIPLRRLQGQGIVDV